MTFYARIAALTLSLATPYAYSATPPGGTNTDSDFGDAGYESPGSMFAQQIYQERTMSFTINGGNRNVTFVIDGAANGVFMTNGSKVYELSYSQIAGAAYPGDALSQNKLKQDLGFLTTDPAGIVEFQQWKDSWKGAPLGNIGGACAFSPCSQDASRRWGTNTLHWTGRPNDANTPVTFPGFSPDIVAYDKSRFEIARQSACTSMTSDAAFMLASSAGAGAGCVVALGGAATESDLVTSAGGIGCVAGAAAVFSAYKALKANDKLCYTRNYPGPGKWESK